ncbi:glycosyl hydrolase family 28 [Kribbella sp. VKM Ac-2569]|uniref:glycoside hydrolase family 28 protein n=1 Tax=Kribbella sp. VKM Ac-2569 TaxID=2512220 RepID=UPI00102B784F|nr:glycoside hydrolase family 28 protein [Kribbella sp. VKM Ac-2569]RZT13228.1 glycosyl hydrolase family 28 [Kribbella sp. VKM Ac-2569]
MTDYLITDYGGCADADCTAAIAKAIDACALTGGRVVVPDGEFVTGPIRLRSNVELHLSAGATLRFHTDPTAYPIVRTRWQGIECFSHSPLIYAYDESDIAITGTGTLDGGASTDNWWSNTRPRTDWERLLRMVEADVPVEDRIFEPGHGFRPSFIQPHTSRRVRIEDVRIVNAPMWVVHPVFCTDVLVRGITVDSLGPNNDGCNPDSCENVVITGCSFTTGDDCIAIKSGRDADGRRVGRPSRNILIESCRFTTGHGALTIGSEASAGASNIQARDLHITTPAGGPVVGAGVDHALRIKTNSLRGGVIEHVIVENVVADAVTTSAILITTRHAEPEQFGGHAPVVRDITVTNLAVRSAPRTVEIHDTPQARVESFTLTTSETP